MVKYGIAFLIGFGLQPIKNAMPYSANLFVQCRILKLIAIFQI